MNPKKFLRLKQQVEEMQSEKNKAEGGLDQLQKRLMDEFDCATLAAAKQLLIKLREEVEDAQKDVEIKYERFDKFVGANQGCT